MSENSVNNVMEESHTLQLINFSSIMMRQTSAYFLALPVRKSLDIITNVTGKLLCIFTVVCLIIPFDRGREYG